jgi:hypothetical protein
MRGDLSELLITLFRLSVSLVAVAAKGNQGGVVQQQIEAMGLRQWLSLVVVWTVERAYTEVARLRDFISLSPTLGLKPATVKPCRPDRSLLDPHQKVPTYPSTCCSQKAGRYLPFPSSNGAQ